MKRGAWVVIVLLGAGLSAGIAVPRLRQWLERPPAGYCPVCRRHEHPESVVRFQAQGEAPTDACCLSCALTYGRQTHKAVTILQVTDHASGGRIDPQHAAFVVGSDVSPCTHAMVHLGAEKEAYPVRWDRCLPSILAFVSAETAATFRAQHGGGVRTLQELLDKAARSGEPLD